jgi:hypothetical protein
MTQPLTQTLLTRWPLLAVGSGLLAVAAILYGCEDRRRVVISSQSRKDETDSCATQLRSGLDQARPTSLGLIGIDAALRIGPEEAAKAFSQWLRQPDCRDSLPAEPVSAAGKALVTRLLGPEGAAAVEADRFNAFDAAHVRDALLNFAAAGVLARGGTNELDRVVRVFDYVARTVSPAGESTVDVPQTAYEAHLFGRGTAEERTQLFADLLRQLRIDSVVLRPAGGAGPWWIGVLLDGGVYLFDPEIGLPVPAAGAVPAAPTFLPKPATWAEAIANPDVLVTYRREAGLTAEPIAADRLKSARVELIGPGSFWRAVMERLELALPEDRGVLLYDPLHDTQAGPGLYRRVADSGRSAWTEEAISIWPYPAELEAARTALSPSQRQRLEQRIGPYLGPVELSPIELSPIELGPVEPDSKSGVPEKKMVLWETRIGHMSGRARDSIFRYQKVRLSGTATPGLTPTDESLNDQAADEAHYWAAHAQYDDGEYETASKTARDYVERGGDRADDATALLALSLAAAGQTAEAAAEAAKLPDGAPVAARLRWLSQRWSAGASTEQPARE